MMKRIFLIAVVLGFPLSSPAEFYYIGNFQGSTPFDMPNCGTRSTPCASLQYWNKNRRMILQSGDSVRIAPGTYSEPGGTHHCILVDRHASGVTYEGRSADDSALDNYTDVIIDLSSITSAAEDNYTGRNACVGRGVSSVHARNDSPRDVVIRSMKFDGAPDGGTLIQSTQTVGADGITLQRLWFTNGKKGGGLVLGSVDNGYDPEEADCSRTKRMLNNVVVKDSLISNNSGFPGGIMIGCVDGVEISGTTVVNNCGFADCLASCRNASVAGCDDHDGISLAGAINFHIHNNIIKNGGEDGIDLGGHPRGKTHHGTIERNQVTGFQGALKTSGSSYVTWRNNYVYGSVGSGFTGYACPHNINIWNNTFYTDTKGVFLWYAFTDSEWKNNIVVGGGKDGKTTSPVVWIDSLSSNVSNDWDFNIVHNRLAGGYGIREVYPGKSPPKCDGVSTDGNYAVNTDCRTGYAPPVVPCVWEPAADPKFHLSAEAGRLGLASASQKGQWFGPGTAQNDVWGSAPTWSGSSGNPEDLHLSEIDTVAIDKGTNLSGIGRCETSDSASPHYLRCVEGSYGLSCSTDADCRFNTDFDGDTRGAAWDIGADEFVSSNPYTFQGPKNLRILLNENILTDIDQPFL